MTDPLERLKNPNAPACRLCTTGPSGMQGHERLALLPASRDTAVRHARFLLRCLDCGTDWHREFGQGSSVRWVRAG